MIEGNFARRELEEISEGTLIVEHNTQKRTMNLHKAKEDCLVGHSIACPVVLEPALIIEEQPIASR